MSVRTYNPSVRVGNWNEDLCLEEDLLKDFLERKQNGELQIYKSCNLSSKVLQPVKLSHHEDGFVRFGDVVCLYNPSIEKVLSVNMSDAQLQNTDEITTPCGASATAILQPCYRNSFLVTSPDGSNKEGDILNYGCHFLLSTLPGFGTKLNLLSDRATFIKNAKKSRLQEVYYSPNTSYLSHWQIVNFDPQLRLETEGCPIKANQRMVIKHCNTNQGLAALADFSFRTTFGRENEIVAHTFLDSHKADRPPNHWIVVSYNQADNQ